MAVTLTNSGITYSDGTTQIKPAGLYTAAAAAPAAAASYTISNIPAHNKIIPRVPLVASLLVLTTLGKWLLGLVLLQVLFIQEMV